MCGFNDLQNGIFIHIEICNLVQRAVVDLRLELKTPEFLISENFRSFISKIADPAFILDLFAIGGDERIHRVYVVSWKLLDKDLLAFVFINRALFSGRCAVLRFLSERPAFGESKGQVELRQIEPKAIDAYHGDGRVRF